VAAVCLFGIGNGMATLVRATAIADAYGSSSYGSIAGVAAACATGARAVAPIVAAGAYLAFGSYGPLLWLLAAASVLGALSARRANQRLVTDRAGHQASAELRLRTDIRYETRHCGHADRQ
jgi:MFS family permease